MNYRILLLLLLVGIQGCSGSSESGTVSAGDPSIDNPNQLEPLAATRLTASHRSGQTFLIWPETNSSDSYHVYRHNAPITTNNLSNATQLTERWGPLDSDTSSNKHRMDNVPANFIIDDLGAPLSDNTGLFVYTPQDGESGPAYYAVTTVNGGNDNNQIIANGNTLTSPINESVATPRPVFTASKNGGKGRLYTQYMDYANWNPTFNGYAYNYTVALPSNYNPSQSYPLQLALHAYDDLLKYPPNAEFDWEFIQLFPGDPGQMQNTLHTWWYGFAADHNYKTDGSVPGTGLVVNFTEQRVMAAVKAAIDDSTINIDTDLIHIVGNSMGGSGALSMGLRYPNRFAGIYASEPMTDYARSPTFQNEFIQIWGRQTANLRVANGGADNGPISDYGVGGSKSVGVWDWMNHLQQIRQRSNDTFAYLMIDHGKADTIIDWQTQGQPLSSALNDAKVGFSASALAGVAHEWLAYSAVVKPIFGLGFGDEASWRYPASQSFPAISNASGSSTVNPGTSTDSNYNKNIEWSTDRNQFDRSISDTNSRYEITLRSTESEQTADITPRRTISFMPGNGQQCSWRAVRAIDGQQLTTGSATARSEGLITATGVPIITGNGTRLTISC